MAVSARKKRKISKHVLKSQGNKLTSPTVEGGEENVHEQPKKRREGKNRNIKSPGDATAYLTQWKNRKHGDEGWKFNKNTQSWLIRHMYDIEKVNKTTFLLLIEYLTGLDGTTLRSRIRSEANRRALLYKEHEKKLKDDGAKEDTGVQKGEPAMGKKGATDDISNKVGADAEQQYEIAQWAKLSEHDKRKVYKRARKVLESITE